MKKTDKKKKKTTKASAIRDADLIAEARAAGAEAARTEMQRIGRKMAATLGLFLLDLLVPTEGAGIDVGPMLRASVPLGNQCTGCSSVLHRHHAPGCATLRQRGGFDVVEPRDCGAMKVCRSCFIPLGRTHLAGCASETARASAGVAQVCWKDCEPTMRCRECRVALGHAHIRECAAARPHAVGEIALVDADVCVLT